MRARSFICVCLGVFSVSLLLSPLPVAGWPTDPATGVPLCTATNDQSQAAATPDGAGGAIVAWQDNRGGNWDVYVQGVGASGALSGSVGVEPGGAPLAFALKPLRPNPTGSGVLAVRFTLASAVPAWLELLDVAGRRLAALEVGSLGAGDHTRTLGETGDLRAGIYFVRLRQGASVGTARVAVVR